MTTHCYDLTPLRLESFAKRGLSKPIRGGPRSVRWRSKQWGVAMAELSHEVPASVPMPPDQILAALGDLEVAHEELRVAEEELAEQREQIERLVARHDSSQRWRDHLFGLLPMGLLVTDAEGKILESNASAADLLGVRPVHLP